MRQFDYEKILRAYIQHVIDCESISFLPLGGPGGTAIETDLTAEEREELLCIDREIKEEMKNE